MHTCKLIIKDEVNCRLEGLPVEIRRKLANKFKYIDPSAQYTPAVRLGRWDGSISFFSIGGDGYLGQLPDILKILEENDVEITGIQDLRNSVKIKFDPIAEDYWGDRTWPAGHPKEGELIRLRDDQVHTINTFLQNPQSIQCLTTSYGKTLCTATMSKICEKYGRTITIVPNKSLVEQTEEDFLNCRLDVGVYYGDRKELNRTHTICTWQSLSVLDKKSKNYTYEEDLTVTKFLQGVGSVIVDECFDGTSNVLTPDGYKPIKDIKIGDIVVNYNENEKIFKHDIVLNIHENLLNSRSEKMYELEFDNGVIIKVTGNHKFLTNYGWVRADELSEKHEILSYKT